MKKRMISHLSLGVKNLAVASEFYDAVFAALGFVRTWSNKAGVGYGLPGENDEFAIFEECNSESRLAAGDGFHLAFIAESRDAVDKFYKESITRGAKKQYEPCELPQYSPTYYATFIWDLDGHRIEVVHQ